MKREKRIKLSERKEKSVGFLGRVILGGSIVVIIIVAASFTVTVIVEVRNYCYRWFNVSQPSRANHLLRELIVRVRLHEQSTMCTMI
jgi:hypothetical protein